MTLGEKIRRLRKDKDWSQAQLAQKLGLHPKHISRYENNVHNPPIETLVKIAELFEVSIDFLLTDEPKTVSGTAIKDNKLLEYFEAVDKMEPEYKKMVFDLIDLILFKTNIERMAGKKN
jgi:transcriptional regulator with XRE-family HTH domain